MSQYEAACDFVHNETRANSGGTSVFIEIQMLLENYLKEEDFGKVCDEIAEILPNYLI